MKLLTLPERMVLLNLYSKSVLNLDDLVKKTKLSSIDCFNALQRLLIKDLIKYETGKYFILESSIPEIKDLLQQKQLKNLEIEQILKSTLQKEQPSIKLQSVPCTSQDLKIIRHHFLEIEKFINRIKVQKKPDEESYYFFWGEQPQSHYIDHLKKQYCK